MKLASKMKLGFLCCPRIILTLSLIINVTDAEASKNKSLQVNRCRTAPRKAIFDVHEVTQVNFLVDCPHPVENVCTTSF